MRSATSENLPLPRYTPVTERDARCLRHLSLSAALVPRTGLKQGPECTHIHVLWVQLGLGISWEVREKALLSFYGMVSNEGLDPSFKYISVYIVHYFSCKSTSVNHFICLFLEIKCDYIEQCTHKKSSYNSNNCFKTYILAAFPQQCTFGNKSMMKT